MTASDLAPDVGLDIAAAEAAYHRARQREVWRRRLLPAVGIGAALLIWAALVYGLKVPPFIAPSPLLVVQTMAARWSVLWQNLVPTALEALGGFMLGNLAAILLATVLDRKSTL